MPSPYLSENRDGAYYFKTDSGLEYKAYFILYDQIEASPVRIFQFSFEEIENRKGVHDSRIKETISRLVLDFFSYNDDVVILVYDNTDSRAACRKRLFMKWHAEKAPEIEGIHLRINNYESENDCYIIFKKESDFKKQIKRFFKS